MPRPVSSTFVFPFFKRLFKLITSRNSKSIRKVEAVNNLSEYAKQFVLLTDNTENQMPTSGNQGSTSSSTRTLPLCGEQGQQRSFVLETSEFPKLQEQEKVCEGAGRGSQASKKKRLFFMPSSEPSRASSAKYTGPGYGKSLQLLPGCHTVPRHSVKQQKPADGSIGFGQSSPKNGKNGQAFVVKTDSSPIYVNADGYRVSLPKLTTPPPGVFQVDEVGIEALMVVYNERGEDIMARQITPTYGLLTDHEILVSCSRIKERKTKAAPEQNGRKVSIPSPTSPPPGMN